MNYPLNSTSANLSNPKYRVKDQKIH
uniref:Uncharacterized protein n=1 Tax=Rhizophora mucronata TaxID=61149 RepID=A0A2P2N681_RHIMU